jgi:hypothetical protein
MHVVKMPLIVEDTSQTTWLGAPSMNNFVPIFPYSNIRAHSPGTWKPLGSRTEKVSPSAKVHPSSSPQRRLHLHISGRVALRSPPNAGPVPEHAFSHYQVTHILDAVVI